MGGTPARGTALLDPARGLYKKASELSTLCGIDIGIIIFSPTDNPYFFFHPSMESVIERYRNPNHPPSDLARIVEGHTLTKILQLNKWLEEVQEWKAWCGDLHARLTSRIEELRNGVSGSLENAPIFPDPPSASTSYTAGGGIVGSDQFSGQYYYARPQGHDLFVAGSEPS
ncbi:UNVERIFIED_CONTAM: Agamous-like MADS-box protein [Sesamum radiatum]|uniref:Agamous-like MADS-box protein n=1 Tax=Sesamum radiatum TaxID=300843 RepID=A0AAW2L0T0_SESRA